MWEVFGLTPVTVWDLPADHFFALAREIDKLRSARERERRREGRS